MTVPLSGDSEPPARGWIECQRGHELRVLPIGDGSVALQVRVDGEMTTTTIIPPGTRQVVSKALR